MDDAHFNITKSTDPIFLFKFDQLMRVRQVN